VFFLATIPEYSAFAGGLVNVAIAIFVFYTVDEVLFKKIDTYTELKNGNIAYAIFLLALAILISASIISQSLRSKSFTFCRN
jgi:uncharacterized membrane protein